MKKRAFQNALWLILTAACIGGTAAYFSAFDGRMNTAAVGRNTTEIREDFPSPSPKPFMEYPEYKKEVRVSNQAGGESGFQTNCYVRVSVSYSNADIGRAVVLQNVDTVNWVYKAEDGYYYYTNPLKEGESTTPLFNGFSIDSSKVDSTYLSQMNNFMICIYEESVQADKFRDYLEAWDYYCNPISGKAVKA